MSLDEAVACALEPIELRDMKMQLALERALALQGKHPAATAQAPAYRSPSNTLTARERDIARLIADGLSNHDMAERLVISQGIVEVHVKHILSKLSFKSRSQVAAWFAHEQDEAPSDLRA